VLALLVVMIFVAAMVLLLAGTVTPTPEQREASRKLSNPPLGDEAAINR
jgi:hypothetical protein